MTDTRKAIHAFVPDESHHAWHEHAIENAGCSVSALVDAIGRQLAAGATTLDVLQLGREARRIDADNRRRRRS